MGRIRTIKPEFPQSESVGRLSRDARLLFIQLWTLVDDAGRCRAAPRMLAGILYPYDADAAKLMPRWMDELKKEGCVCLYSVDGSSYLQICKWKNHQKIERPSPSRLPAPPCEEIEQLPTALDDSPKPHRNLTDDSPKPHRNLTEESATDLGPRTMDLGPWTMDHGPIAVRAKNALTVSTAQAAFDGMVVEKPETKAEAIERLKLAVWGYYLERTGRSEKFYSLTKKRRGQLNQRFEEALHKKDGNPEAAAALLKICVDMLVISDWHIHNNAFDWSTHLFLNPEKFEGWLMKYEQSAKKGKS